MTCQLIKNTSVNMTDSTDSETAAQYKGIKLSVVDLSTNNVHQLTYMYYRKIFEQIFAQNHEHLLHTFIFTSNQIMHLITPCDGNDEGGNDISGIKRPIILSC